MIHQKLEMIVLVAVPMNVQVLKEIHLGYVCQERVNQHEWRISHHYT
jgi:hypothetical protein